MDTTVAEKITTPVTMTIEQACERRLGLKRSTLAKMCLRKEIRAVKIGKGWHVSVADLDRVFLGKK